MKVVKCERGHFYDSDSYVKCPHCNPSVGKIMPKEDVYVSANIEDFAQDNSCINQSPEDDKMSSSVSVSNNVSGKGGTSSAFSTTRANQNNNADVIEQKEVSSAECSDISAIRQELANVSNSSAGKTVGIFGKVSRERNKEKEPNAMQTSMSTTPVVGWLVAISGPHIGQSFVIVAGKNSIGRTSENDIILSSDLTVSSNRHAWITYEAKHNNFVLQAGDGRYPDLNGEQILNAAQLKTYDKIEIGETVLLFVDLCSDTFRWEDYL